MLQDLPKSVVATSTWLNKHGLNKSLAHQYEEYNWLESLGTGAYKRYGEDITWEGALYAIQKQLKLDIHVGAKTALEMQGKAHNINLNSGKSFLFTSTKANLPQWFKKQDWQTDINLVKTQFLRPDTGLKDFDMGNFKLQISSVERAILESLYLVPKEQDFQECYYLMEGLMDMRPKLLQCLLEECKSIKVKRLFLFLTEKADLPCFKKLDLDRINLGSGKRAIITGGNLDAKYQITYPKGFQVNE